MPLYNSKYCHVSRRIQFTFDNPRRKLSILVILLKVTIRHYDVVKKNLKTYMTLYCLFYVINKLSADLIFCFEFFVSNFVLF